MRRLGKPIEGLFPLAEQCVDAGHVVLRVVVMAEGTPMLDRELDLIPGASGLPSRSRNQSADAEHQNVAGKTSGAQLRRLLRLREQAQTQLAKREVICAPRRRRLAHDSLRGVERLPIAALVVMTEREMGLGHHVVRIDLESASK